MTVRIVNEGEEPLAARLTQLDIPLSDRFVDQVLSRYRSPAARTRTGSRQRRVLAGVALLASLLGGAVAVPPVRTALAATPVVGPAVSRLAEMAGLPGGLPVVRVPLAPVATAAASDNGYTITVMGSYADSVRTLVVLRINPASATVGLADLLDANGDSVANNGDGLGGAIPGEDTLSFNPFKTAAKGDTVTLRIRILDESNPNATGPGITKVSEPAWASCGAAPCPVNTVVRGRWDIPFRLTIGGAQTLTPPSPGDIGPVHVTFTAVTSTPVFTEVRLHADGPLGDEDIVVADLVNDSGATFHSVGGTGGGVDPLNPATYSKGVPLDPQHQDLDNLWMGVPKGHYRLVVTWLEITTDGNEATRASFERDVALQ